MGQLDPDHIQCLKRLQSGETIQCRWAPTKLLLNHFQFSGGGKVRRDCFFVLKRNGFIEVKPDPTRAVGTVFTISDHGTITLLKEM